VVGPRRAAGEEHIAEVHETSGDHERHHDGHLVADVVRRLTRLLEQGTAAQLGVTADHYVIEQDTVLCDAAPDLHVASGDQIFEEPASGATERRAGAEQRAGTTQRGSGVDLDASLDAIGIDAFDHGRFGTVDHNAAGEQRAYKGRVGRHGRRGPGTTERIVRLAL
jgi:hypothetical protein